MSKKATVWIVCVWTLIFLVLEYKYEDWRGFFGHWFTWAVTLSLASGWGIALIDISSQLEKLKKKRQTEEWVWREHLRFIKECVGEAFLENEIQVHVNATLREQAEAVNKYFQLLILLQRKGIEAVLEAGTLTWDYSPKSEAEVRIAYESIREYLEKEFKTKQNTFYDTYARYQDRKQEFAFLTLLERDWKAYLKEEGA